METTEGINKNIETFYEIHSLDIPEVKKAVIDSNKDGLLSSNADESLKKQYRLYKGFIASNQLIEELRDEANKRVGSNLFS